MPRIPKLPPPMPRLPKEPAPEMLRSFGPRPRFDAAATAPGAAPVASPSPSAFRAENPYQAPPAEYKPPSFLKEHARLAILFGVVAVAFAFYCLRAPHRAAAVETRASAAPAAASSSARAEEAQPIYIEAVPEKESH